MLVLDIKESCMIDGSSDLKVPVDKITVFECRCNIVKQHTLSPNPSLQCKHSEGMCFFIVIHFQIFIAVSSYDEHNIQLVNIQYNINDKEVITDEMHT